MWPGGGHLPAAGMSRASIPYREGGSVGGWGDSYVSLDEEDQHAHATGSSTVGDAPRPLASRTDRLRGDGDGDRPPPTTTFGRPDRLPDVPADNVHRAAIDGLAALEIVVFEGYDDGTFRPGNAITRGQLASVVARILGLQAVVPAGFSDTAGSTHEGSIGALAQTGIIRGYADGTFRPGDTVRRDHAATIVARWLGLSPGETGPFTDVGGHHAGAINVLERVDVVEGRTATTFEPLRAVTRAQTASLVYRGWTSPSSKRSASSPPTTSTAACWHRGARAARRTSRRTSTRSRTRTPTPCTSTPATSSVRPRSCPTSSTTTRPSRP
jgi:hypothetical protein